MNKERKMGGREEEREKYRGMEGWREGRREEGKDIEKIRKMLSSFMFNTL